MKRLNLCTWLVAAAAALSLSLFSPGAAALPGICEGTNSSSQACELYKAMLYVVDRDREAMVLAFLRDYSLPPWQAEPVRRYLDSLLADDMIAHLAEAVDRSGISGSGSGEEIHEFLSNYANVFFRKGIRRIGDEDQKYWLLFYLAGIEMIPLEEWTSMGPHPGALGHASTALMRSMPREALERHLEFLVRTIRAGTGLDRRADAPGSNLNTRMASRRLIAMARGQARRLPDGQRDEILAVIDGRRQPDHVLSRVLEKLLVEVAINAGEPEGPSVRAWLISVMTRPQ